MRTVLLTTLSLLLASLSGFAQKKVETLRLYKGTYSGEVISDTIPQGQGKMLYPSGEEVEGMFAQGVIHGKATLNYKQNTAEGFFHVGDLSDARVTIRSMLPQAIREVRYEGNVMLHRVEEMQMYDFVFGNHLIEKTGNGTLTTLYVSGDTVRYHGMFLHDVYHGHGALLNTLEQFEYRGHFEHGEISGAGEMHFKNGELYRGYFKDGQFSGRGYHTYDADSPYVYYNGMWLAGKWHGRGTLKYRDGSTYTGEFLNGEPHGKGKRVFADGSFFEGVFLHGKPTKAINTKYTGGNNE